MSLKLKYVRQSIRKKLILENHHLRNGSFGGHGHHDVHHTDHLHHHHKDHGMAWVVLAAAFTCHAIIIGSVMCFGIYVLVLVETLDCHRTEAAFVGSIAFGTKYITGLISGLLYKKLGCRLVVMSGGLIASIGMLLSYFATRIEHLYISFGLITGLGFGLSYSPAIGVLPDYFEKWRYFATGFVTVGSAIGTLVFSPFFLYLINTYSWQGSMLINSGVTLHIVLFGSLLKSRTYCSAVKFSSLVDIHLLKDVRLYLLMLCCALWSTVSLSIFSMINQLAVMHGMTVVDSTLIVSVIGISNVIGRLISSLIGQQRWTNRLVYFATATFLLSVAAFSMSFASTFLGFTLSGAIFGFNYGSLLAQLSGVMLDIFGLHSLMSVMGFSLFSIGLGAFSLTPIAGWLSEATGLIECVFYFAAFCGLVSSLLMFQLAFIQYKHKLFQREKLLQELRNGGPRRPTLILSGRSNSYGGPGCVPQLPLQLLSIPELENWEVCNSQRLVEIPLTLRSLNLEHSHRNRYDQIIEAKQTNFCSSANR